MDYNTSRKKLVLPEYGRNIQKLVDFAATIEDKAERNKVAKAIITIMGNMNPHLRDISDFKHKLWDHLAIMSEFNLDIDSPYESPKASTLNAKPKPIPYNSTETIIRIILYKGAIKFQPSKKYRYIYPYFRFSTWKMGGIVPN